ncbi:MAG: energy transducer TonB [Phenylobacterium sp.]|uniref:energy transducer TonB n=1 Tax=Phenylobacterium sp. TaxID=1871053 RepID=UPI00391C4A89
MDYRRASRLRAPHRLAVWGLVAGAHGLALAGLLIARNHQATPEPAPALMVSLISETPAPAPQPAEPPPPQPRPPEPPVRMTASTRPTTSPMTAPPPEEQVRPAPPQPTAPPSPSAAAASAPAAGPPSVTPPNFTAAYLNNPGPQYPYESRRKREQGIVQLKVLVGADGRPEQVLLDKTSGFPNLDAAALDIVRKRWRFAPATQGDRPVAAWVAVPMQFSLKDR